MVLYGVDVYSGSGDYIQQQSQARFSIIKTTQGTGYVNPKQGHQKALADSLGHLTGFYHYAGGGNPEAEADYFLANLPAGVVGKSILALDWESYQNAAWGDSNWCKRFTDHVHAKTGVWSLVYVSESALGQVSNCTNSGKWVAKYATMDWNSWTLPNMNVAGNPTIWQFTGGDMDRDIFYGDANTWAKIAKGDGKGQPLDVHKNETPAPNPPKAPATWVDNLGVTWYKETGTFTITESVGIWLRWGATTSSDKVTVLPQGSAVKYDAFCYSGGYVWIRQPRGNGSYAYLPTGRAQNGKRLDYWGTFK